MQPRTSNEVKGYQRFAHELAFSLAHVEGVVVLSPTPEFDDPGLAYEEFALRWHLPCPVPGTGQGAVDDRSLPWSADVSSQPAGSVRGVMPLDGVAREISQLMFQKTVQQGFQARSTLPWCSDNHEGDELIAYTMGGYTYVASIGPGPREDLAEVTIHIMVAQPEFENTRNSRMSSLI